RWRKPAGAGLRSGQRGHPGPASGRARTWPPRPGQHAGRGVRWPTPGRARSLPPVPATRRPNRRRPRRAACSRAAASAHHRIPQPTTRRSTVHRRLVLLAPSLLVAAALAASPTAAQHSFSPPNAAYDPAVPTPRAVLGYEIGERFTPHHMIMRYADALAATSRRVRLDTVAHT